MPSDKERPVAVKKSGFESEFLEEVEKIGGQDARPTKINDLHRCKRMEIQNAEASPMDPPPMAGASAGLPTPR